MKYFVYILECADKTLYSGYTNNLERRLKQHNHSKQGAHYTKIRRPVKLLYSETFGTLKEALRREYKIKQLTRAEKLELISNNLPKTTSIEKPAKKE
jgi:putative endonuclease